MAAAKTEETWQYNKSVLERNKFMLENQLTTDITFLVGENPGERLRAHQYVLISGSPVFYSMFCGEMRETGEVQVPDVTPEAFSQMLRFLYYEEAEITGDLVMQILYAAKKYLIPALTAKCTQFLEKNLDADNAAIILEQCITFDEKEVVSKCMEVIQEQTSEVLKSESFSKISHKTLLKILESDNSSASEVELFQASVDWAKKKISKKSPSGEKIRTTLGQVLYKLRFPTMDINEFANVVAPMNILSKDEQLLCFQYLTQNNKPAHMPFPTELRIDNGCAYIHLEINGDTQCNAKTTQAEFTIENCSSSPLVVVGFVPYEVPSHLYCHEGKNYNLLVGDHICIQEHLTGACPHTKGQYCITFPAITIPDNAAHKILMDFNNDCDIVSNETVEITDSSNIKRVIASGEVPIKGILIENRHK